MLRSTGDDYIIYLVTGIIPWTFFQTVVNECVTCIKTNAGIIKKVYFPREILPLSAAISGVINFFISCIIILVFCLIWNVGFSYHLLFVPLLAVIEAMIALGIGMALGAMAAYVQDLEYIVNFVLMMAFYASPIVYQIDMFASSSILSKLIIMNPMTRIMNGYRGAFLYHTAPGFREILILIAIALVVLCVGWVIFKKLEKGFAEQF